MKHFSTYFKAGVAAVAALFVAGHANASVPVLNLVGSYEFTADLELMDEEYGEVFITDNVVTVTEASTSAVFFTDFVLAESTRRVQNSVWGGAANQIGLQAQEVSGAYGEGDMYFANIDGLNPTGSRTRENYYIVLTYEEDGTLTMPDFSIVQKTGDGDYDTIILAKYTNAVMTPIASDEPEVEAHDFQGIYSVTGTQTVYTDGDVENYTVNENAEFPMIIYNNDGNTTFDAFGGYDNITAMNPSAGVFGSVDGDVLSFLTGATYLLSQRSAEVDPYYITTGGPDVTVEDGVAVINNNYRVTFTFNEGTYELSDFTIWKRFYAGMGDYVLLEKWSNLSVTQIVDSAFVEKIEENVTEEAPVFFNLQGQQVSNPSNGIFIKKQGNKATKVLIK